MRNKIRAEEAKTIPGLFRERVKRSPDKVAYQYFDDVRNAWQTITWKEMAVAVAQWQSALEKENLSPGDRVGLMMRNCCEWIMFELAAFRVGLVTVPLNALDHPENVAHILEDAEIRFLLIEGESQERLLQPLRNDLPGLRVVRLDEIGTWLPEEYDTALCDKESKPNDLATIFYTSGTTGHSKGAMVSHKNILSNAEATASCITHTEKDVLVAFVGGYTLAMLEGIAIAYPRSFDDLRRIQPTVIVSATGLYEYVHAQIQLSFSEKSWWVRHIFERTIDIGWRRFEYQQGRGKWHPEFLLWPLLDILIARPIKQMFGGRVRCGFYAGAKLSSDISRTFIGLGFPLLNCYGQTEAGPVISMNRPDDNVPASVGKPLSGVNVRVEENGELLAKGPGVMMGYLNNPATTEAAIDKDGWLQTGDMVRVDAEGRIFFLGRISDIIFIQNGEKVSPAEAEAEITADLLFDQALVVGKERPFLTALIVLNDEHWKKLAERLKLNPADPLALEEKVAEDAVLARVAEKLRDFPDHARIRRVTLLTDHWTVESGLLTPSMKLRRTKLFARYAGEIEHKYKSEPQINADTRGTMDNAFFPSPLNT